LLYGRKYLTSSGLRVENFEQELYDSVLQTFYSALPYTYYGIKSSSYVPSNEVHVVSISQDVFGEEIKRGTVSITLSGTSSYDDSMGNLIVSQSNTGSIIGRIFYDKGIILIKPTSSIVSGGFSVNGMCIVSGSSVGINFTSSVKLYEHSVKVKINPAEYNFSLYNPSIKRTFYTGSNTTPLQSMVSRSSNPENTQYLAPYVTSIGLYNAANELIAVAKVSNPIQRSFDSMQTFIIKFDT
jgi:hypothetical protein